MRYTLARHQYLTGWTHYVAWRHRERVRFGAWEERPQGAAVGRSGPGTGGSEGPQIPGPENTYKCEGEGWPSRGASPAPAADPWASEVPKW